MTYFLPSVPFNPLVSFETTKFDSVLTSPPEDDDDNWTLWGFKWKKSPICFNGSSNDLSSRILEPSLDNP